MMDNQFKIEGLANIASWERTNEIAGFLNENGEDYELRQAWVNSETGQKEWIAIPTYNHDGSQNKRR